MKALSNEAKGYNNTCELDPLDFTFCYQALFVPHHDPFKMTLRNNFS